MFCFLSNLHFMAYHMDTNNVIIMIYYIILINLKLLNFKK